MAKFLTLTDKCNLRCSFCYEISPFGEPHEYEAPASGFAPLCQSSKRSEPQLTRGRSSDVICRRLMKTYERARILAQRLRTRPKMAQLACC